MQPVWRLGGEGVKRNLGREGPGESDALESRSDPICISPCLGPQERNSYNGEPNRVYELMWDLDTASGGI